jgi:antirestriction protein ArdC
MAKTTRPSVYTRVTDKIIADLSQGVRPWTKPWTSAGETNVSLPLRHNGEAYRGINVLLLWSEAIGKGFRSASWMTYRQALELGGHVRKGETGSQVVYANNLSMNLVEDDGTVKHRDVYMLRAYTVFNLDQIDGLPNPVSGLAQVRPDKMKLNEAAEQFVAATSATIRHGGDHAYYTEMGDAIQLPHAESFHDAEGYAATQLHELVHWTKHASRLDRHFASEPYAYKGYSREELVAELGAAFLCALLGVTPEPREDHAAYISHWLKILQGDNRAIFSAAAQAQRAVDYLIGLQSPEDRPTANAGESEAQSLAVAEQ